jgi:hypothetical protein
MMAGPKRKVLVLAIGLGALLTAPAAALSPGEGASKSKSAKDPSRRVCRSLTPTATRFATRVCKTKADWDSEMSETQDSVLSHQWKNSGASEGASPK